MRSRLNASVPFLVIGLTAVVLISRSGVAEDRPNIVWILSEDNSIHYSDLYGESLAKSPNIGQLASEGLVFEHAFSCAPVCSVARTTLMSGILAPRAGFQFHRKLQLVELDDGAQLFPHYLKQAGYYTTNRSKKDYNVVEGDVWNESSRKASWRNRPTPETPFFHMETIGLSHESSLHFKIDEVRRENLQTDPGQVKIAPYHPDTEIFRFTTARYIDRIRAVDRQIGGIVKRLAEDGVLDQTIIFYFGDHGGVLPRSKGYLYETGLHVPLVIRVPERYREALGVEAGQSRKGFVNFSDFGPTALRLAGVSPPSTMDGQPFLGEDITAASVDARNTAYGYADRFDEKIDLCRSLRKGRYKYIRNFEAHLPDGLQNNYRYVQLAYSEWREAFESGNLNDAQRAFFEPKAVEALYDLSTDPFETKNLAEDPNYQDVLSQLRGELADTQKSWPDLSFYPESDLIRYAFPDATQFGREHKEEIAQLIDVANLALLPQSEAEGPLLQAMSSDNSLEKYWGCIAAASAGFDSPQLLIAAKTLLDDSHLLVRVRAAEYLAITSDFDPRDTILRVLRESESPAEVLLTLNTVVFLRDFGPKVDFELERASIRSINPEVERRLKYLAE